MNRIKQLFQERNNILSVYFTAGYPNLEDTKTVIKELVNGGVQMLEIGFPFSDPLADGPVIQQSGQTAIENGITLIKIFDQLIDIRKEVSIPLILMGYFNNVLQLGVEAFLAKAQEIGIDGVIIPDLPLDEYIHKYKSVFEKYNINPIFLVTPQTSESRIRLMDQHTDAFLYLVTTNGVTGGTQKFNESTVAYFEKMKNLSLINPLVGGFGISSKTDFETVTKYLDGGIIGSAFIRAINKEGALETNIQNFITELVL